MKKRLNMNSNSAYNPDIEQLLNGQHDREEYRIENAFFEKKMVPAYKGAKPDNLRLAIEYSGAIEGHKLVLSGVEPGTNILFDTLKKWEFQCGVKNPEQRRVIEVLYKYLRKTRVKMVSKRLVAQVAVPDPDPVTVPLPSDPRLIWDVNAKVVEIAGMRFCVTEEKMNYNDHRLMVVYVRLAPYGTELYGVEKKIYVTVGQLKDRVFYSPFREGTPFHKTQERIWSFFHGLLMKEGIGHVSAPLSVAEEVPLAVKKSYDAYEGSRDILQFLRCRRGFYVFGEKGGQVLVHVRLHTGKTGKEYNVIEIIRCEAGSFLYGKCRSYTRIPCSWLCKPLSEIEIKGSWASDMAMLHVYLSNVIDAYQDARTGKFKKNTKNAYKSPAAVKMSASST